MSIINDNEIPVGLGMALAQNLDAMQVFTSLNESEKQEIIHKAQNADSKEEMFHIVSNLSNFKQF